jgi:putative ABC transport system permease protein
MYRLTAAGQGLLVSDNFAELQRLHLGDVLEVPAPHGVIRLPIGVIRLPITGIMVDYSDQQGTILMDRSIFQTFWRDDSINVFRGYLEPGAQVPDVKRRILERFAGERQVFVLTNGELKT